MPCGRRFGGDKSHCLYKSTAASIMVSSSSGKENAGPTLSKIHRTWAVLIVSIPTPGKRLFRT